MNIRIFRKGFGLKCRVAVQAANPPSRSNNLPRYGDAELYTKLLLLCGHGYPQWIPEPDILPEREHGICIGDVGIIDPRRSFDFLFNICNTSASGLPEGTPSSPHPSQRLVCSQICGRGITSFGVSQWNAEILI